MKNSYRRVATRVAALLLLSVGLVGGAALTFGTSAASAAGTTPPWEPLANPPEAGGLLFFNAAGQEITGGSIKSEPVAAYVEGTAVLDPSDSEATLEAYTPVSTLPPAEWSGEVITVASAYPNTSAPAPLNTLTLPVYTGSTNDPTLATYILGHPNTNTTSGYANLYVLRIVTSGPDLGGSTSYDSADISVTTTAGTWSVVYPASVTSVAASPASPQPVGTTVTLTATVSPSLVTGTVGNGTVEFEVGSTTLGTEPVTDGTASLSTTRLPAGVDTVNAVFTPTGGSTYSGSTGNLVYTVTTPTTTTLTASPASPQPQGTTVMLTATVSEPAARGTVEFEVSSTDLGTEPVSDGTASLPTTALPVGVDDLSAVFTPTSGSAYAGSTGVTTYTVTSPTTTTLTTSPASPQVYGATVTLIATVSPPDVTGTVQFEYQVGSSGPETDIGLPQAVSGGTASLPTTALPVGTDTLGAVFTPTESAVYGGSTGTAPYTIDGIPTTTTLAVSPGSPQAYGTSVALTATIDQPAATGTVQFEDNGSPIGAPVPEADGTAATTTADLGVTLPVGTNSLGAVFTPAPASEYSGSTAPTTSYTIIGLPTSTSLSATPASPQAYGTAVTLSATVSPSTATGTVQFEADGTALGTPVAVTSGTASTSTTTLSVGTDTLTAVYTPASGSAYASSTGTAQFTVVALTPTTTTLTATPASPQAYGTAVTLSATVSPFAATGTVQFEADGTALGTPVAVTSGTASTSTTALPAGAVTLSAVFTPTAGNGFSGSTGTASFTVGRSGTGYWLVASDGGVFSYGTAPFYGSMGGKPLNKPIVGIAATVDGRGYWEVASDGGIFAFGDANFYGSMGGQPLNKPIVGIAVTPDGRGYWEVASDGGIFAFGDAGFYGSMGGQPLNKPIVGIAVTPDGKGYWEVASDGGIFAFGDATFYGSTGNLTLDEPVVGIVPTPDGGGYWLAAADGGLFAFGDAGYYGSVPAADVHVSNVVGIIATPDGGGYWLVGSDGGVYAFGDASFYGSAGSLTLDEPVVGLAEA